MSETPKHASGKTDFELVEAAIDVAVNGADLHEDDEECPQDDTCECRDAATVNDGHRALVRMDRDISSLREQVRALTAQAHQYKHEADTLRGANIEAGILREDNDALRARVAEMEKEHEEDQGVIRVWRGRTERAESERDAYRDSLMETAHFYMEWAMKDGNSPGYNIAKARTYGDKANEYRIRSEKADAARDAAQQRAKALEKARDALLAADGCACGWRGASASLDEHSDPNCIVRTTQMMTEAP